MNTYTDPTDIAPGELAETMAQQLRTVWGSNAVREVRSGGRLAAFDIVLPTGQGFSVRIVEM